MATMFDHTYATQVQQVLRNEGIEKSKTMAADKKRDSKWLIGCVAVIAFLAVAVVVISVFL